MKPEPPKPPHKLDPMEEYEQTKTDLSENAQSAAKWVELGIAEDPYHRVARYQYPSSRIVVDYSADNLAISYYVLADGTVVLLDITEGKS
jgi:hypothetical protein